MRLEERLEPSGQGRAPVTLIESHFAASAALLAEAARSPALLASIEKAREACTSSLRRGGKLLLAGNGGSAGDAQHIAGEFLSRLNFDRAPLAAIALSADASVVTSVGNDYGFEHVFARQIHALARAGDVFIALSTSGRSPNILRALAAARTAGCVRIAIGGLASPMADECDILIEIPSRATPLIQQVYMVAAHALCGAVERDLFSERAPATVAP